MIGENTLVHQHCEGPLIRVVDRQTDIRYYLSANRNKVSHHFVGHSIKLTALPLLVVVVVVTARHTMDVCGVG